jgi:hypothetical protein
MHKKTWLTLSAAYAHLAAGPANAQYHSSLGPRAPQVRTIEVASHPMGSSRPKSM